MHAHDCPCPAVDEWAFDPYAPGSAKKARQAAGIEEKERGQG
jgi:hypothetical protein